MDQYSNLLDESLRLDNPKTSQLSSQIVFVQDCVETSGSFVLHHLIKRSLSSSPGSGSVIYVSLSQSFSHFERILRKLGCNLAVQRKNMRFFFIDMLMLEHPDNELVSLYGRIHEIVEAIVRSDGQKQSITIMIDDLSLMEVVANGSTNNVLNFLHYCTTLTSEFGCSLVLLNHIDIYSSMERPDLISQLEYLADIMIKAKPLSTGLANDVHGQLTVVNKGLFSEHGGLMHKIFNFQFRIKENAVEYFYPGFGR